jgi:ornithine cyclodeaminase/alanine dehydrogenase
MTTPYSILYLAEEDVRKTVSMPRAVELAEKGIRADASGQVVGDKFYTAIGDAGFIKPFTGYILGEGYFYVKTFTFFPGNPENFKIPVTGSQVLLFDARNGLPVCLMEAGWVTGLKTGASTAVTASILAHPDSKTVAIFGAGLQGRMHTRAITQRFHLESIWLLDLLPEIAIEAAADLSSELGVHVEAVPIESRESIVRKSDIVITVTTGNQTLVHYEWLQPHAFVAKLGSYTEIDLDVILKADKVVVDNWHYVSPRIPEIRQLLAEERFSFENIHAEWPNIVAGRNEGRQKQNEIIVFIGLGIWGEYATLLPEVYRQARRLNLGQNIPLSYLEMERTL